MEAEGLQMEIREKAVGHDPLDSSTELDRHVNGATQTGSIKVVFLNATNNNWSKIMLI
jgi:hypothetical protein